MLPGYNAQALQMTEGCHGAAADSKAVIKQWLLHMITAPFHTLLKCCATSQRCHLC
jgi:hypothetical protein